MEGVEGKLKGTSKGRELSKTLDIYRNIAVAINSFPKGEKISVKKLAVKAKVHWSTAKKALNFFSKIVPLVPKLELFANLRFEVKEKPSAMDAVEGIFESQEMRMLTKMMLVGATEQAKGQKLDAILSTEERGFLTYLTEQGYVNSINGNYFLSERGQSIGSMGLRRIVELSIPLPWEIETSPIARELKQPSHLLKQKKYSISSLSAPTPIYKRGREELKGKNYIS